MNNVIIVYYYYSFLHFMILIKSSNMHYLRDERVSHVFSTGRRFWGIVKKLTVAYITCVDYTSLRSLHILGTQKHPHRY